MGSTDLTLYTNPNAATICCSMATKRWRVAGPLPLVLRVPVPRGFRGTGFGFEASVLANGIDGKGSGGRFRVKEETTPGPMPGMRDEFSLDGIHVHGAEFFDEFLLTPDMELIEAGLPE